MMGNIECHPGMSACGCLGFKADAMVRWLPSEKYPDKENVLVSYLNQGLPSLSEDEE